MSQRCDFCDKAPVFGRTVSRLGRQAIKRRVKGRSPRRFNPNIQSVRTVVNGTPKKLNVCTSCLKAGKATRAVSA
ncbi:50S ribosomal protein L28 [Streptomyces sp. NPDC047002]|jgi:large subunit ribosomal protein L28|uniref:Large ribosomal subunit protein bL28 n=2 Tax=Streptomyces TaxID=1883 RepID=A0A940RYZ6_9ACTN|nr:MULTISPECIES: 50S ribosomal protein L28 [Streptomyces]MBP0459219.1 50S ribosomal protein L28 [Streptomyces montanisoli]